MAEDLPRVQPRRTGRAGFDAWAYIGKAPIAKRAPTFAPIARDHKGNAYLMPAGHLSP
jgi:hypothetical protein